ncbi:MAG: DUF5658 family protein [Actinomycetota bacterium]
MRVAELQIWEAPREMWLRSMLVVAILVLNIGDIVSTEMSMARGGIEINPLSGWLIENGVLTHTKMSVVAFIAVAAAAAAGHRKVSNLLWMVAGFYFVVVGANTVQLLLYG